MVTGKKILIVAHYFSPMNSSGARRPEALASFLARKGIPVIVLTTKKKIRAQKSHFVQNVKVIECALLSTLVYESISENNFTPESRGVIYSFLKKFKQQ